MSNIWYTAEVVPSSYINTENQLLSTQECREIIINKVKHWKGSMLNTRKIND